MVLYEVLEQVSEVSEISGFSNWKCNPLIISFSKLPAGRIHDKILGQ